MIDTLLLILVFGGAAFLFRLLDIAPIAHHQPYEYKQWQERQKAKAKAREERKRKDDNI